MSRSTNATFTCPCGNTFTSPIYEYVNIAQDPQLQYTILAGLLNVATCPSCGRRATRARPFIYSDAAHNLLAYVHPRSDAPEEARLLILEKLRDVYTELELERNTALEFDSTNAASILTKQKPGHPQGDAPTILAKRSEELPPLSVIFGLDQLNELINATLQQGERLGRLALSTSSRNEAERGQMLVIARKLVSEMNCQIEVEELPDEYTIWLYGSRRQIGAIMRELAPRG